jgi:hypothetical protein
MVHVHQHGVSIGDDLMTSLTTNVGYESHAATFPLKCRIVQALFRRQSDALDPVHCDTLCTHSDYSATGLFMARDDSSTCAVANPARDWA